MGEAPGRFQMMRRSAFEKVKGYREDLITREDGDMFARLSKVGRTLYDSKLEVFHSGRRAHAIGWAETPLDMDDRDILGGSIRHYTVEKIGNAWVEKDAKARA